MRREQGLIVAAILTAEVCSALESTMVLAALHSWIRIYKEPALVGWVVGTPVSISLDARRCKLER